MKHEGRVSRLQMCPGPVTIAVADVLMTLYGQPVAYWANGYFIAHEDNPFTYWLLTVHPAVFVLGSLAWICCFILAILVLPLRAAQLLAFGVILGYSVGLSTWLLRVRFGVFGVVLLFLLVRLCVDKLIWPRLQSG